MLELFSPQKVPEVPRRSTQPKDRQVIEWEPREALPWEVLRPPPPVNDTSMKWQHTVYLGVYDLEDIYQDLHDVFAEDRDAYDERTAGLSACAAVMLDERGALMVDSATLSSALWAVARIRSTREVPSPHWGGGFSQAAEEFTKEVDSFESLNWPVNVSSSRQLPSPAVVPTIRVRILTFSTASSLTISQPSREGCPMGSARRHCLST